MPMATALSSGPQAGDGAAQAADGQAEINGEPGNSAEQSDLRIGHGRSR